VSERHEKLKGVTNGNVNEYIGNKLQHCIKERKY
jgi:hypothetical protein